jgi:predicted P-loop ATPase
LNSALCCFLLMPTSHAPLDRSAFSLSRCPKIRSRRNTRAVGRLALVAAVRRIRQPGCGVDQMLVLADERQGTDISSALRALCPDRAWFTERLHLGGGDKEAISRLAGKWIVEASELAGLRRGDIEAMTAFVSRQVDPARRGFLMPRQCTFAGTTKAPMFVKDSESRRYWPVRVCRFDAEAIPRDRDQLWAEAAAAEAKGESIRLTGSFGLGRGKCKTIRRR